MKIRDFGVEMWMNEYENNCTYNLAETCVKSLTVKELIEMSSDPETVWRDIYNMQLTYGAIEGSDALKAGLASLYKKQKPENIVVFVSNAMASILDVEVEYISESFVLKKSLFILVSLNNVISLPSFF